MPKFVANLHYLLEYAQALQCNLVHAMASVVSSEADLSKAEQTCVENLRYAAEFFKPHGVRCVIERINRHMGIVQGGPSYTTQGMHGYFLNHSHQARRIIERVATDNLFLHLDVYHMQLTEGHLAETLHAHFDLLRHVQIAGVPGRHEPDWGEIHYPFLFELLDTLGYDGWIGCEYRPRNGTLAGLGWAAAFGIAV